MNMSVKAPPIEFIDLKAQRRRLGPALDAAIRDAVEGGQYILGPQVAAFEQKLAAFSGARHAIGTANGTDAIVLCLAALGIKAGESTTDGEYHLQGVRCLGCCGLAPLASVNGKVYGKQDVDDAHGLLGQVAVDRPTVSAAAEPADAE